MELHNTFTPHYRLIRSCEAYARVTDSCLTTLPTTLGSKNKKNIANHPIATTIMPSSIRIQANKKTSKK
jgi:hypothetical protein